MQKNNVREVLIKSATDLFAKKGYLDTSIRDIGNAAKVNPSLIYHYFKNKEEILFIIVERFSLFQLNYLQQIPSMESDPVEGLRRVIFQYLLWNREYGDEIKITVEEISHLRGRYKKDILSYQRKIFNNFKNQLIKLDQLGMLSQGNLSVICFSIFGMINWFYRWFKESGQLSDEGVANQMIEDIFSGIIINRKDRSHEEI